MAVQQTAVIGRPKPEQELAQLSALKYLIVDDSHFARNYVKNALTMFGFVQLATASEAGDALKLLEEQKFDVLLVDNEMPMLSGVEMTRMIRRSRQGMINCEMPIIMISGRTDEAAVIAARDSGVHEFLAKPFSAEGLYARIRSAVLIPRQFIRTPTYIGPDRRIRALPVDTEAERRKQH